MANRHPLPHLEAEHYHKSEDKYNFCNLQYHKPKTIFKINKKYKIYGIPWLNFKRICKLYVIAQRMIVPSTIQYIDKIRATRKTANPTRPPACPKYLKKLLAFAKGNGKCDW